MTTNKSFNPLETTVDGLSLTKAQQYQKDLPKAALVAAANVEDRQELSDILEMIGAKPYVSQSLYENRLAEKRVYKETYIKE